MPDGPVAVVGGGPGRRGAVALNLDALGTWSDVGRMAGNDSNRPVFGRHPEIRAAFEALVGTRPLRLPDQRSGSTLFAVYRSGRAARMPKMMWVGSTVAWCRR